MFCGCSTAFGAQPNENVCPRCMGDAGRAAGAQSPCRRTRGSRGPRCSLRDCARIDFRSQELFYPDLPKGYQISQYLTPVCKGGYIEIALQERRDRSACDPDANPSRKRTPAKNLTGRRLAGRSRIARECRWSKSSASPTCAAPRTRSLTCARCTACCATPKFPTRGSRKAVCAAT